MPPVLIQNNLPPIPSLDMSRITWPSRPYGRQDCEQRRKQLLKLRRLSIRLL
jgi:hypothetical protein